MPKIKFVKEKKELEVPKGANLRQAMMENGISPYAGVNKKLNCGGHARCGTCRVYLKQGDDNAGPRTLMERIRTALGAFSIGHEDEVRLSCQTTVEGDMTVETTPDFNWYGEELKYTTQPAGLITEEEFH
jgi:ferredoxin